MLIYTRKSCINNILDHHQSLPLYSANSLLSITVSYFVSIALFLLAPGLYYYVIINMNINIIIVYN